MSAYLDKSQGITFVYSNIYELYKKAKDADPESPYAAERKPSSSNSRVIKDEAQEKVEKFTPKEFNSERSFTVPMGVREAEERAMRDRAKPMTDLKKSLSEMTDAHEKLRFLLQELESLTKK